MWKLICLVLDRLSLMCLFCGMCFLVMFSCVIIFRCVVMCWFSFIGVCVIIFSRLLMCRCMWQLFLQGLKWMFEVFLWIVFISILLMNFIIGVLLFLVLMLVLLLVLRFLFLVVILRLFMLLLLLFSVLFSVLWLVCYCLSVWWIWFLFIRIGFIIRLVWNLILFSEWVGLLVFMNSLLLCLNSGSMLCLCSSFLLIRFIVFWLVLNVDMLNSGMLNLIVLVVVNWVVLIILFCVNQVGSG